MSGKDGRRCSQMERKIRVRGVRRKQLDEDKLAYAYMLLAKAIMEKPAESAPAPAKPSDADDDSEAA
jgi:hypothetical protein